MDGDNRYAGIFVSLPVMDIGVPGIYKRHTIIE